MADLTFSTKDKILRWSALIVGSLLFSFPFYWLVITSWKGEREVFEFPPTFVPELPISTLVSPYIHTEIYDEPDLDLTTTERTRFETAMWDKALSLLRATDVEPWEDWSLQDSLLRVQLLKGIWSLVLPSIPLEIWETQERETQLKAVLDRIDEDRLLLAWNGIRKEFLVGPVTIVTPEGLDVRLEPVSDWRESDGRSESPQESIGIQTVSRKDETFERIRYDFTQSKSLTLSRLYRSPALSKEPMFWSVQFRYDLSHHHVDIRLTGAQYDWHGTKAVWLDSDQFYEVMLHRPEIVGDVYDYEVEPAKSPLPESAAAWRDGVAEEHLLLTLTLTPSNILERWYGKLFRNYRMALVAFPFERFIGNSIYLVVLNIIGQLISCSLIAYGFARLEWPGRDFCFLLLLATMMLPPQVTTIPVFLVFKTLGWYNTLKPLWIPAFFGAPFFIFLLRQFFLGIPKDLEEAAHIDGCGYLRTFTVIMVPLIRPALAAIAIFQFMNTWNDFFGPLIYTNDMDLAPLPLGLFIFKSSTLGTDFGMLMAVTTVMTLPVIAIFFLAQRYFIQGITLTGMKG